MWRSRRHGGLGTERVALPQWVPVRPRWEGLDRHRNGMKIVLLSNKDKGEGRRQERGEERSQKHKGETVDS